MPAFMISLKKGDVYTSISGKKAGIKTVWGCMSQKDNEPTHFWITFLDILSSWNLEFIYAIRQNSCPIFDDEKAEAFIRKLLHEMEEKPLLIVLSDVQMIKNKAIWTFLEKLQNVESSNLILVLQHVKQKRPKKTDPRHYKDVMSEKLYYTETEEFEFYLDFFKSLTEEEFKTIRPITDGWIPAVEIVSYLLGKRGKVILTDLNQYLLLWFTDEYLPQLSKDEIKDLSNLSLVNQFPLELGLFVRQYYGDVIELYLKSSPMFRYNQQTGVYTYAEPFRQKLLEYHELLPPKEKSSFYIRIAKWYEERDDKINAVNYYNKAGAYKKITDIMTAIDFPMSRGMAQCYLDVIEHMPERWRKKNIILELVLAYSLCALYRYKEAYYVLKAFCSQYDRGEETPQAIIPLLGEMYMLLSYVNLCVGTEYSEIRSNFIRLSEVIPEGNSFYRSWKNKFPDSPALEMVGSEGGSFEKSMEQYKELEPYLSKVLGNQQGRIDMSRAELLFYTRNFKELELYARRAIVAGIERSQNDLICNAYFLLMRYYLAKGNYKMLMENYALLEQEAENIRMHYDTFYSLPDTARSWLMLKLGRPEDTADWIKSESQYRKKFVPWNYGRDRVVRCYYLLEIGQYGSVAAYAEASIELLKKRNFRILVLYLKLFQCIAYYKMHDIEKSMELLNEIYDRIYKNGMTMIVAEFGSYIRSLFDYYRNNKYDHIPLSWLEYMERKAQTYYICAHNIRKAYEEEHHDKKNPLKTLSPFEAEVLQMLGCGNTSTEIAEVTGKTPDAIRASMKRIYQKLDAKGRADAIRIAAMYYETEQSS